MLNMLQVHHCRQHHAALKRCFSTTAGAGNAPGSAGAAVADAARGILLLFAADRATDYALKSAGWICPAPVANVILLGACAANPRGGRILERVIGLESN
eukprot:gene11168-4797_t